MRKPSIKEKCFLCNYYNTRLIQHLKKSHNLNYKSYYDEYIKIIGEDKCHRIGCNNLTSFQVRMPRGYNKWCSISCMNIVYNSIPEVKQNASIRMSKMWDSIEFRSISDKARYEGTCNRNGIKEGYFYIAIFDNHIKVGVTYLIERRMRDLKPNEFKYYFGSIESISEFERFIKCKYKPLPIGSEYFDSKYYKEIESLIPSSLTIVL